MHWNECNYSRPTFTIHGTQQRKEQVPLRYCLEHPGRHWEEHMNIHSALKTNKPVISSKMYTTGLPLVRVTSCTISSISFSFSMTDWTGALHSGPTFIFKQCHTAQEAQALHCYYSKVYWLKWLKNDSPRSPKLYGTVCIQCSVQRTHDKLNFYNTAGPDVHSTNCILLNST